MKRLCVLALSGLLATPVSAEVMTGAEAKKQLFSRKGHVVQVSDRLTDLQKKIVRGVIPLMAKQLRQPVRYYASIAFSPDDGMVHDSLQAAMNHHSYAASDAAAVKACNGLKSKGAQSCRVAARVVPKRFKTRDLTLSLDATVGFQTTYLKARGAKSFAVSASAGNWGMGASDAQALKNCELNGTPGDCRVIVRDQ
ncbi:MAG: hypothetical protein OIF48_10440 [Silicimonas sp.]|nr:hypothetical protein [Silicimonas sp.]